MDIRSYFVTHINEAVTNLCAGQNRKGQEIQVIVPIPGQFSIDCCDVNGINLDNAVISIPERLDVTDENGTDISSILPDNAVLYKVTGLAR